MHSKTGIDCLAISPVLSQTEYSRLLAEISARLVKVSNEELDAEILHALRVALQPLGVDRGGLIEVWEESPVVKLTHAWYDEGIGHVSGEINLAELFPWSYEQLVLQGNVVAIEELGTLPPDAEADRQSHVLLGNKSSLSIPLFIGQRIHQILAVNANRTERSWPDEVITHLRLLGEIFVSALQRREADLALHSAKERLKLAAESADAGLWDLDIASGALWITEQVREMFHFEADLELTLEHFMTVVHVEDRAMVKAEVAAACHNGKELKIEYRAVLPDGQVCWRDSRGRLQAGLAGGRRRLMGVTLDITNRKQMEQQLQAQLREIEHLREQLEAENVYLRNEMANRGKWQGFHAVSGSSMQAIMVKVEQVASTGSTVLIEGETGTGKELIAQNIHQLSPRGRRVMVKVNCAALPAALVESELFGREKGAFTGALSRQEGRFELADGSTLFLDEIAEIPLETQAKLLRVLQEGEFERLGSPKTIKVDVRVIAATNRNLAEEVEQGRFRRDLYYRLNVFPIRVPPLREHPEDIPQLVWEFVNEFGERMGKKIRRIGTRDMEQLKAYSWPGNIRELRNVIEHAMIVSNSETLKIQRLVADVQNGTPTSLEEMERHHIQNILTVTGGRIKGHGGAAELLGLNPSTLYSRMRKLGISSPRS